MKVHHILVNNGVCNQSSVIPNKSENTEEALDSETLEHSLAAFLLCKQTMLRVSQGATQQITEELHEVFSFSSFQTLNCIKMIIKLKRKVEVNDTILDDILLQKDLLPQIIKGL